MSASTAASSPCSLPITLRFRPIPLAAAAFALLATSCGGGGGSASTKARILRVGTTYYVDSFNPLIGIETQDSTADEMVDGLKAFRPENHLPIVAGAPYTITRYQEKGTIVFKPNPGFYGPKSHAAAVTLTYYTNRPWIDPDSNLSEITSGEWNDASDTGFADPRYDAWYKQEGKLVDFKQRQALVWKMEAYAAAKRPYIQLVDTDALSARSDGWTGFPATLWGFCKCFYTSPKPTS